MGYRNYIWVVDKDKADPIRNLKPNELKERFLADNSYLDIFELRESIQATEAIELGKEAPHDVVLPYLFDFFTNVSTNVLANNPDMELNILNVKALDKLCEYYRDTICKFYKELTEEDVPAVRLKTEIKQLISWLKIATEEVNNKYILTDSWRYDHAIFNFMYLKKIFNPTTQDLIWVGY